MKFTRFNRLMFVFIVAMMSVVGFSQEAKPVKYVFLFIGDGLSIPQRMMTDEYLARAGKPKLLINQFDKQAITSTRAANSFITDSAASGTAIACGEKTNNGRIGMNAAGDVKLTSVAEVARDSGRKVGIVTSVTINHATPAAFYAHNMERGNYYQIGLDLVASGFDYFGGGGVAKHDDKRDPLYKGDIYQLAKEAGYTVSRSKRDFEKIKAGAGKVLSFGASGALAYALDRKDDELGLVDFTRQAIEVLDNDKGFFLMVEGGKIDWLCHGNDAASTIHEVIDFDNAVRVAYEFWQKHPEDTLIVVTGDHETGGLTLGFAGTGYTSYIENLGAQKYSREGMRLRFAAQKDPDFEKMKPLITKAVGLVFDKTDQARAGNLILSENDEAALRDKFNQHVKEGEFRGPNALSGEAIRILNNKSAVAWTSGAHTALPVSTTAVGAESDLFSNMLDNTDISKRLKLVVR